MFSFKFKCLSFDIWPFDQKLINFLITKNTNQRICKATKRPAIKMDNFLALVFTILFPIKKAQELIVEYLEAITDSIADVK